MVDLFLYDNCRLHYSTLCLGIFVYEVAPLVYELVTAC